MSDIVEELNGLKVGCPAQLVIDFPVQGSLIYLEKGAIVTVKRIVSVTQGVTIVYKHDKLVIERTVDANHLAPA